MVAAASSCASKTDIAQTLNKLDQEGEAYMKHAEKKCRRQSPAGFPSLLRPRYGFANAKCTVLFCGGTTGSYGIMAIYAAPQGDAKSMLHFNSLSTTSNFACRSVRRSVITFESTGNATGGNT